jgi:hypothetical protein
MLRDSRRAWGRAADHHMSFPTTSANALLETVRARIISPHLAANAVAFSAGIQNSMVRVSKPKPRKIARMVAPTSFRLVWKPKALISAVNSSSSARALPWHSAQSGHESGPPHNRGSRHLLGTMTQISSTHRIM